jgi:anti-sigma B factor antagonist
MEFKEKEVDGKLVLILKGKRLDAAAAPVFKHKMMDVINRGQTRIALDMSNVDFMDSTGLASLLSSLKSMGDKGKIVLFGLNKHIKQLFTITRLDKNVFQTFNTEEESLGAL